MEKKFYELTNSQKNIWNTEMFFKNTNVNNVSGASIIKENINIELLKAAINKLVELNDSFRIHLTLLDGKPVQFFTDYKPFDIEVIDVSSDEEFLNAKECLAQETFEILNSSLFKFKLAKFPNGYVAVMFNSHHIICDSWSSAIIIQEIVKIYHSILNNEPYVCDTYSYIDSINDEIKYEKSSRYEKDKAFWSDTLSNIPEPVTIPHSYNKTITPSTKANRIAYNIDQDLMQKINKFCKDNSISNFAFFMSIYSLYIANVSNVTDLILGTPILNRTNFREKHTIGMFVTTIPFRIKFDILEKFTDFSVNNNINLVTTFRHQKYSYSDMMEDLRENNYNIPNLYNVAISYQITKALESSIGDYDTTWTFNYNASNDLSIHLYDWNDTRKVNG